MNVNTTNATPLLDEVISVSKFTGRVFHDGTDLFPLWFEVCPDVFFCGSDLADARNTQRQVPHSGVSWSRLIETYPRGLIIAP